MLVAAKNIRVKAFYSGLNGNQLFVNVDTKINEWLEENPDVAIVDIAFNIGQNENIPDGALVTYKNR